MGEEPNQTNAKKLGLLNIQYSLHLADTFSALQQKKREFDFKSETKTQNFFFFIACLLNELS